MYCRVACITPAPETTLTTEPPGAQCRQDIFLRSHPDPEFPQGESRRQQDRAERQVGGLLPRVPRL